MLGLDSINSNMIGVRGFCYNQFKDIETCAGSGKCTCIKEASSFDFEIMSL